MLPKTRAEERAGRRLGEYVEPVVDSPKESARSIGEDAKATAAEDAKATAAEAACA